MSSFIDRLIDDDSGQDLIEYALLTTFIGLAAIAVFDALRTSVGFVYGTWNTGANNVWRTPNPSGS
jgi:pilus assembly protein Flp/PilA